MEIDALTLKYLIFAIKMRSDLIKNIVQEHLSYRQAKKKIQ